VIKKDEVSSTLPHGISRREVLKGIGYGAIGATLMPTVGSSAVERRSLRVTGAQLSGFTPEPMWTYTSPYPLFDNPVFAKGTIVVTAQDSVSGAGVLYALDSQTNQIGWSCSFPFDFFCRPLVVNGVLYVADVQGHLFAISLSGNVLWQRATALRANFRHWGS
jgi:outer membrane protein assembly factor BamB